jgi:hypothetical protein
VNETLPRRRYRQPRSGVAATGHDVQIPADVGNRGGADAEHLIYAIQANRAMISHNHGDFGDLHNLVRVSGGSHPGMFVIRRDQDRRRHLSPAQVVRAIANVASAGLVINGEFIVLNQWQ